MAPHSSTLAWKIPWPEEPGKLQSMGSRRVGHDWATSLSHIGEGNGNPLQLIRVPRAWRIPGTGDPDGLPSMGLHRVGHDWSDLAAAAAAAAAALLTSEKAMAPHSSTLAWEITWTEEPGELRSMGLHRVGHDWVTSLSLFIFLHWKRKWQPTLVFLPGESQGQGSLVGFHLWGRTESDTTEAT